MDREAGTNMARAAILRPLVDRPISGTSRATGLALSNPISHELAPVAVLLDDLVQGRHAGFNRLRLFRFSRRVDAAIDRELTGRVCAVRVFVMFWRRVGLKLIVELAPVAAEPLEPDSNPWRVVEV